MGVLLEVERLEAYYGQTQALHGVSFSLEQGGITTLLGANGAGKTTTLRAICNMVRTQGTIKLDGKLPMFTARGLSDLARHAGIQLKVAENAQPLMQDESPQGMSR